MDRGSVDWRVCWVAAPTPFAAAGAFDEQAFCTVQRLYHRQGVHGVLVNGTTGEWFAETTANGGVWLNWRWRNLAARTRW
jgi:1-pyrroline-4-hydroxy-2-carboxylate deaminase